MNETIEFSNEHKADDDKNKEYVITDAVGRKHFFIAGENGINEDWISRIRYGENEIRSSDFHFYHSWNGKHYRRRVFPLDTISTNVLEHSPSMNLSRDPLSMLIEGQDQAIFERKYNAAMDSLTDQQWRLVYKRFELEMSDMEIAREEGVSKMAISKRWDRIQKKINKFFTE